MKRSWWSLKINDYPSFKPNDADLEHIAEAIKQGYDQGELIQEDEEEKATSIKLQAPLTTGLGSCRMNLERNKLC